MEDFDERNCSGSRKMADKKEFAEEIIACELTRVEAKICFELLPVLKYVSPVCVRISSLLVYPLPDKGQVHWSPGARNSDFSIGLDPECILPIANTNSLSAGIFEYFFTATEMASKEALSLLGPRLLCRPCLCDHGWSPPFDECSSEL